MRLFRNTVSLLCALLLVLTLMAGCATDPAENSDATSDATASEAGDASVEESVADDTAESVGDDASVEESVADTSAEESTGASGTPTSGNNNNSTTTKKPDGGKSTTKGVTTTATRVDIPETEDEKWGTEAGTTSVKKAPAWMKQIKSGEIVCLTSGAYGEGAETEEYRNLKTVFKTLTGKELKVTSKVVDWNSLRSTLQTMVISGNGPDVFGIYNGVGYYLRNKGLTRDIRDYINMNDAAWEEMKEPSEVMFYKGELTGVVTGTGGNGYSGFVYNKTLINQAGLDDPWELYKQGKWNITTFLEYVEELTVDQNHDNTPEVFGVSMAPESLFRMALASGEDLVKFNDDGTVTNNLRSPTFTRWASYARDITEMGSYDTESWTGGTRFAQGKIAMADSNIWRQFQSPDFLKMKKEGKLGWVPTPLDINAKYHYMAAEYSVEFLPKNSKNPEGGAAYLYAQRYMALNPNAKLEAAEKEKYLTEYAFTEEEWDFLQDDLKLPYEIKPITFNWMHIPDFSYTSLWNVFTEDWATLVEEVYPTLQSALDAQNK